MNREGKEEEQEEEKGRRHMCTREGKMNRVRKGRKNVGRKERSSRLVPPLMCNPGPKLRRCLGARVLGQVVFDDTLGAFPV